MSINCLSYELYWNDLSRNINPIATQQAALNNALVPSEKRLKIERCNARIAFSKPQREETYQVTLEALKLSPCYPAFEDFMYQADNRDISLASKEHKPYHRLTKVIINHFISKDKTISMRNMINLYTICNDSLLGTLKFVSKIQDYQQYEALIPDDMINQHIKDSSAYQTYYDFACGKVPLKKARKYKKVASPSRKLSLVKEAEPVKKAKRVKRPAKKSTTAPIASDAIRDTPGVSVSKKKAHAKSDKSKGEGTDFELGVLDEQQHKTSGTDEGTGTKLGVLDEPTYNFESENESWVDSEEDNDDDSDDDSKGNDDKADSDDGANSDADDNERTDSDDDENPSFTLKD
ncbi:hypothetical protein Tco_0059840 [Tanacetum coccineum]